MMKYVFPTLALCCALPTQSAFAQMNAEYDAYIQKGNELYQAGQYRESAGNYEKAFAVNEDKGLITDRYNAACSWALAGETDAAFKQLFRIPTPGKTTSCRSKTLIKWMNGGPR